MRILDDATRCHPERPAVLEQRVVDMPIERWSGSDLLQVQDLLAVEEALEIRLVYGTADQRTRKTVSVTMRTPGNDLDLAIGFLFAEGLVRSPEDVQSIQQCGPPRDRSGSGMSCASNCGPGRRLTRLVWNGISSLPQAVGSAERPHSRRCRRCATRDCRMASSWLVPLSTNFPTCCVTHRRCSILQEACMPPRSLTGTDVCTM